MLSVTILIIWSWLVVISVLRFLLARYLVIIASVDSVMSDKHWWVPGGNPLMRRGCSGLPIVQREWHFEFNAFSLDRLLCLQILSLWRNRYRLHLDLGWWHSNVDQGWAGVWLSGNLISTFHSVLIIVVVVVCTISIMAALGTFATCYAHSTVLPFSQ